MPPEYGSIGPMITTIGHSQDEEKLLIRRMKERASKYWIPKRYVFSLLLFAACCLTASYNINLSITIVSMVNKTEYFPINRTTEIDRFFFPQNDTDGSDTMQFNWNADIESCALGAVYYGQLLSMVPGGRMAELYGGKKTLLLCMLLASLSTLLLPLAAAWNPYVFIIDRVLLGVGTGPIIPIMFHMLGRWIPETERSFHASFILSGYGFGACAGIVVSGALCAVKVMYGWPLVFFSGGIFGLLFVLFCAYMMCETPDDHPSISDEEYCLIMRDRGLSSEEKVLTIPWKEMALSIPLWALAIGFFGQYWLLGFFSTVHAVYMGTVLNLPTVKNGMLTCIPHLLRAFATILASWPVDKLLERRIVSVGFVRKGATLINSVVSCAAFYGITLVGRNVYATTLLFMLGGVLGEFVTFGVCMACMDIAPSLSGTVSGVINIIGVIPFCLIPSLVGWLTDFENSIAKWKLVFDVTIAVVLFSTVIFVVFGDLRPQIWGVSPEIRRQMQTDYEEITNDTEEVHTAPKKVEENRRRPMF